MAFELKCIKAKQKVKMIIKEILIMHPLDCQEIINMFDYSS